MILGDSYITFNTKLSNSRGHYVPLESKFRGYFRGHEIPLTLILEDIWGDFGGQLYNI